MTSSAKEALREQFVCESCRKGGDEWMCQCDNDAAWEQWMLEQEQRSREAALRAQSEAGQP